MTSTRVTEIKLFHLLIAKKYETWSLYEKIWITDLTGFLLLRQNLTTSFQNRFAQDCGEIHFPLLSHFPTGGKVTSLSLLIAISPRKFSDAVHAYAPPVQILFICHFHGVESLSFPLRFKNNVLRKQIFPITDRLWKRFAGWKFLECFNQNEYNFGAYGFITSKHRLPYDQWS